MPLSMPETLETRLVLPISPEIRAEALRTWPARVNHVWFDAFADGIKSPDSKKLKEHRDYVAECEKASILPYSSATIRMWPGKEAFPTTVDELLTVRMTSAHNHDRSPKLRKAILNAFLNQGRINEMNVKFVSGSFEEFRADVVEKILNQGYQVTRGLIGHYNGPASTSVNMSNGKLEIEFTDKVPGKDKAAIIQWYEKLEQKYK